MRGRGTVLLVVLAVVTFTLVGFVAVREPKPIAFTPPPGYQFGQAAPEPPALLVVGDSYAAGATLPNSSADAFPALLAQRFGYILNLDAEGGTGFVNTGRNGATGQPNHRAYGERLGDDARRLKADIVLITGGRNDAESNRAQVASAQASYLAAVRSNYPKARLVVVAPFWSTGSPPPDLLGLRDAEQASARKLGATFIDPLGEEWITSENAARFIGPDGVHPTVAGQRYLADRLADSIRAVAPHSESPATS